MVLNTGVKIHWGIFQLQGAVQTLDILHHRTFYAQVELCGNGGSSEHIKI